MFTTQDFQALLDYLDRKETEHIRQYGLPLADNTPYDEARRSVKRCMAYARNAGLLDAVAVELPVTVPALKLAA